MEGLTELRDIVRTEEEATFGFSLTYTLKCNKCGQPILVGTTFAPKDVIKKKVEEHLERVHGTHNQTILLNGEPFVEKKWNGFSIENFNGLFEKIKGLPQYDPDRHESNFIDIENTEFLKFMNMYELFEAATCSDKSRNTIRCRTDLPAPDYRYFFGLWHSFLTIDIENNDTFDQFKWRVSKDIEQLDEKKMKSCFTAKLNGIRFIFQRKCRESLNCFCTNLVEGFIALRDYCSSLFPINQQKLALHISSELPYELENVLNIPASPIRKACIYGSESRSISSFVLQTFGLVNENSYFFVSQKCELDYTKFHNMLELDIYEVTPLTPDIILTMNNKETIIRDCQFDVEQIAELLSKYRHYDCGRIEKIKLHIEGLKGEQAEEIFDKTKNIIRDPDMPEEAFVRNIPSQDYARVMIGKDLFELRKSYYATVVRDEPIKEVESVVKNEPIEEVESVVKNEPIEETEFVVRDEPVEEVASVVKDEPIEEVTLSKKRRVE